MDAGTRRPQGRGKDAGGSADPLAELRQVELILQGETWLFDQLVMPYRRRLHLHILRVVGNPSDADDVLQDTLIRAFRALKSFRGDASFSTWMYRIGINCALAFVTRKSRMSATAVGSDTGYRPGEWEVSESDDPENIFIGKQMADTVDAALESMRPDYRRAILLHEMDGLSYHEIADAMLCPVGTVRSRISSARSAIAHRLKQNGYSAAPC